MSADGFDTNDVTDVTNTSLVSGAYAPGMSQPGKLVTLEFPLRGDADFSRLDKTLREVFVTNITPCERVDFPVPAGVTQLAWRVMLLASQLAQGAQRGVVETGKLLFIAEKPKSRGVFRVQIVSPFGDYGLEYLAAKTYTCAFQIIDLLVKNVDKARFYQFLDKVHKEHIGPALAQGGGGESLVSVLKAAHGKRIPFRHLGQNIYRLGLGCRSVLLNRSAISSDSALGALASQNKVMAAKRLRDAGLPAPRHLVVNSGAEARQAALRIGWPVVVKPADKDRGEGVVVDINDEVSLKAAFNQAAALSRTVLVEKQVAGVCHRLFVVNAKKILFVSKRLPKSVTGDGRRTVAELMADANERESIKAPWLRLKPFPSDKLALECLGAAGLSLESVPEEGQYAPLRQIQSVAEGGVVENLTDQLHPENADIVLRAAALFNLDSVGIDFITEDISRPWFENGAIINEVNFASQIGGSARIDGRASGYLGEFLDMVVKGNGRIPIESYVGGSEALSAARARHGELGRDGLDCFLCSHDITLRPDGAELRITGEGLFQRVSQLLANRDVEVLVLVIQTDELLDTGSPLDRLGTVCHVDADLRAWRDRERPLSGKRYDQLVTLVSEFADDKLRCCLPQRP